MSNLMLTFLKSSGNKKKTYADRKICGTVFNMVCKDKK